MSSCTFGEPTVVTFLALYESYLEVDRPHPALFRSRLGGGGGPVAVLLRLLDGLQLGAKSQDGMSAGGLLLAVSHSHTAIALAASLSPQAKGRHWAGTRAHLVAKAGPVRRAVLARGRDLGHNGLHPQGECKHGGGQSRA